MRLPLAHRWLSCAAFAALAGGCATAATTGPDQGTPDDGGGNVEADVAADGDTATEADGDAAPDATSCTGPADCAGAPCVDGVCCDTACAGTCMACNVAGHEGTCTAIPFGDDPAEECLAELPAACGGIGFCNGAGACAMYGEETSCDDGDPCTTNDVCTGTGSCAGTVAAACDPGPADQCCVGACDTSSGCYTTAGTCAESCAADRLVSGQTCVGCGAAAAEGVCTGGTTHACTTADHTACEEFTCGGTLYRCTNQGGTWAWRTGVLCDDGDPCTYNDACFGGSCSGTGYSCTSDACMARACDGAGGCTETPEPFTQTCGTVACPADSCAGAVWHDYAAECTKQCDGAGSCSSCTCTPASANCAAGAGNVCCASACSDSGGCYTVPGSCGGGDVCSNPNVLTVGSVCSGCGLNGAVGTCGGGGGFTCNSSTHVACQTVSCGGTTYRCTNASGTWQWRTGDACDDGDPCTHDDVCGASGCAGTRITCTSDDCATRTCNGTASCTVTNLGAGTPCGSGACPPDSCSGGTFHDYAPSCPSSCDGHGTCLSCTCGVVDTPCAVGPTNQCCTATCDASTGCGAASGTCADVCSDPNTLTVGRGCSGCTGNGANGTCGSGTSYVCRAGSYTLCQTVSCGGTPYYCTNQGGTIAWRGGDSRCDDGVLCTYNDVCAGAACSGTTHTCTPTPPCINSACDGTASCSLTYNPGVACDDGSSCTTGETCNASGLCTGGSSTAVCGDTVCNCGETAASCPADCGVPCPTGLVLATWDSGADGWSWDEPPWRRTGGYMGCGSSTRFCSSYTKLLTYGSDVDLSGCTTSATLHFSVRLVDDDSWSSSDTDKSERLFVECSGNSGSSWTSLVPSPWPSNQGGCSTSYCDGGYGNDRSFSWTSEAISLPSGCRTSQARFRFRATGSCIWNMMDPGWYVDTVSIN